MLIQEKIKPECGRTKGISWQKLIKLQFISILSPNKFASLDEDSISPIKHKEVEDIKSEITCSYKNKNWSNKPKVLMVPDSYGRWCQELLKEELEEQFKVAVIVKPNSNFEHVTKDLLTETDFWVYMEGLCICDGRLQWYISECQGGEKVNEVEISLKDSHCKNGFLGAILTNTKVV